MAKSKSIRPRKVKDLISLEDCFKEIGNALNYWFPLENDGDSKQECEARHDRLFNFYIRLRNQLEVNSLLESEPANKACKTIQLVEEGQEKTKGSKLIL